MRYVGAGGVWQGSGKVLESVFGLKGQSMFWLFTCSLNTKCRAIEIKTGIKKPRTTRQRINKPRAMKQYLGITLSLDILHSTLCYIYSFIFTPLLTGYLGWTGPIGGGDRRGASQVLGPNLGEELRSHASIRGARPHRQVYLYQL